MIRWQWLGLIVLFCCTSVWASELADIRIAPKADGARVVFDLDAPTTYHQFTLHNPERLVVDLDQTQTQLNPKTISHNNTPIHGVRFGNMDSPKLRVVFDLAHPINSHSFRLAANGDGHSRIVVDVTPKYKSLAQLSHAHSQPQFQAPPKPQPKVTLPKSTGRNVVIVIDPGHGGKDPGASGPHGAKEKTVVLGISKELYKLIKKEPGMTPAMTRYGDYYVTLRGRLQKARRNKADMFIAVHADAYKNSRSHGASVFALSERGATSEAARWIAAKENYSELGGVDLKGKDDMLRSVLIDLSQTATITSSLQLGHDVLQNLRHITPLHQSKVEQARFVVLKSPDIPSVLVETGFISNPSEERRLNSKAYQQQMAQAIMKGIREYFYQHPPQGTWIAAHASQRKYVVKSGDTLSTIAARNGVTTRQLKQANNLTRDTVNVGTKLVIPV
ncbi:MAG: N-acetylmuramoyl-L-alanine amidase [Legionellales bacterium]|nr:N-acetylmuramoyl-L-alanine amidase [Legionellales bacterium]|tara:strand:+ start:18882 stop:20219 length:1338 start_codon:yes stop_codon:yes gene_type:complete